MPEDLDACEAAARLPDTPKIWTDGSLVLDEVTGVSCSGSGFFCSLTWSLLDVALMGSCGSC